MENLDPLRLAVAVTLAWAVLYAIFPMPRDAADVGGRRALAALMLYAAFLLLSPPAAPKAPASHERRLP
jgi:hypothetical protein